MLNEQSFEDRFRVFPSALGVIYNVIIQYNVVKLPSRVYRGAGAGGGGIAPPPPQLFKGMDIPVRPPPPKFRLLNARTSSTRRSTKHRTDSTSSSLRPYGVR